MPEGDHKSLISIDFWGTLVVTESGGRSRREKRREALSDVSSNYTENPAEPEIDEAMRLADDKFNRIWRNYQRTPKTRELVMLILNHLGIPATREELDYLVESFEESFWESPPRLADHVPEILPELGNRYSLALISDTMYSTGRVIRSYLEDQQIKKLFKSFIFSDEKGYSKPNRKAFETVLEETGSKAGQSYHIGDLPETDIKGAHLAGMNSILFTGISGRKETDTELQPDHECTSWKEVAELLL